MESVMGSVTESVMESIMESTILQAGGFPTHPPVPVGGVTALPRSRMGTLCLAGRAEGLGTVWDVPPTPGSRLVPHPPLTVPGRRRCR